MHANAELNFRVIIIAILYSIPPVEILRKYDKNLLLEIPPSNKIETRCGKTFGRGVSVSAEV